jgi:hypothetical protein
MKSHNLNLFCRNPSAGDPILRATGGQAAGIEPRTWSCDAHVDLHRHQSVWTHSVQTWYCQVSHWVSRKCGNLRGGSKQFGVNFSEIWKQVFQNLWDFAYLVAKFCLPRSSRSCKKIKYHLDRYCEKKKYTQSFKNRVLSRLHFFIKIFISATVPVRNIAFLGRVYYRATIILTKKLLKCLFKHRREVTSTIFNNVSFSCLNLNINIFQTEINDRGNLLRWPRDTLYPQKLALLRQKSGGRSVGIVRSRIKATEFRDIFHPPFISMVTISPLQHTGQ